MEYSEKRHEDFIAYKARKRAKGLVYRSYYVPLTHLERVKAFVRDCVKEADTGRKEQV